MALVTISGFPMSGKSQRAQQLEEFLVSQISSSTYDGPIRKVIVISDDSLTIGREVYDDSRAEKPARAAVFAALTRDLAKDTVIIMDGMNYIKGYRYQIYCAGREAQVRMCTLFVVATPEECRKWNEDRDPKKKYSATTFDNLLMRFEEPNSMARWDSPLYTVSSTDELPVEAIWQTITSGSKAPTNVAVLQNAKPPTDALQTLETTSTTIINLLSSSTAVTSGFGGTLPLPLTKDVRVEITLPARSITLAELQRHKRQFVSLHKKALTQGAKGSLEWNDETVARQFVEYLETQLGV